MDETEIDKGGLEQLAAVYGLLARLWLKEVDEKTLVALNDPQLRGVFESLGGLVPSSSDQAVVDELAVDYCQLLVGPSGHVSPVQSIWMDNQFQGRAAGSMQRFLDLIEDYRSPSSIIDHIGNQFDFLGELFARAAIDDHPETYTGLAERFFDVHLEWTGEFLNQVEAKAETDFYRGLARLTRNFLQK